MYIRNVYGKNQIDKKIIGRCGNAIGGAFLISFIANEIIQGIMTSAPFLSLFGLEIFSDEGFVWVYQIVITALMFTLPFILVTPLMNVRVSNVCRFGKPKKGLFLPTVLIGVGVSMIANILGSMAYEIFAFFGFSSPSSMPVSSDSGIWITVVSLLGGAALPALIEEFALRGVVLGTLRRFGSSFGIIVSAALFGLMHGNVLQIPFAFVMGIYLGFAVEKTGTVWTAVLIHFINNFFAFGFDIIEPLLSEKGYNLANELYFMMALAIGLVGLLIAVKRQDFFKLPSTSREKNEMSIGEKISHFVATPGIIVFLIYILYEIIMFQLAAMLSI